MTDGGPRSTTGSLVGIDVASMDDDAPVSVYRAWALKNNLQHLIDQYPQHRINWQGNDRTTGDTYEIYNQYGDAGVVYYSVPFLHTWLNDVAAVGLDVRVCGYVTGGTLTVSGRIVPANPLGSGVFDTSVPALWEATATTTSTTPVELSFSPGHLYFPDVSSPAFWAAHTVTEGGFGRTVRVAMSRLDLKIETPDTYRSCITGILVREFC